MEPTRFLTPASRGVILAACTVVLGACQHQTVAPARPALPRPDVAAFLNGRDAESTLRTLGITPTVLPDGSVRMVLPISFTADATDFSKADEHMLDDVIQGVLSAAHGRKVALETRVQIENVPSATYAARLAVLRAEALQTFITARIPAPLRSAVTIRSEGFGPTTLSDYDPRTTTPPKTTVHLIVGLR